MTPDVYFENVDKLVNFLQDNAYWIKPLALFFSKLRKEKV